MAQIITPFEDESSLVDLAVSAITGQISEQILAPATADSPGDPNKLGILAILETNVVADNGSNKRTMISKDDDDVSFYVPVEGKAVEKNLFVGMIGASNASIGTSLESDISSKLNDLRQILDDAEVGIHLILNPGNSIESAGDAIIYGFGFLKETQTEDYNPLSKISSDWAYKMFNIDVVNQLYKDNEED